MVCGQKLGQWHRTNTYSSLVTGCFELRAMKRGGEWIAQVDVVGTDGDGYNAPPLAWATDAPVATREGAEAAARDEARKLAMELLAVTDPTPITLGDIMTAESALAAANVPPPYELRAPEAALLHLLADGSAFAAATKDPTEWPEKEPVMGRVSHTLLIAVSPPEPSSAFRVSGTTPVGEAVYEPGKGPPRFAR